MRNFLMLALSLLLVRDVSAQVFVRLSGSSKYACLIGGKSAKVVIPTKSGFRTTSFADAKDDIDAQLKTNVNRRTQIRKIRAEAIQNAKVSKAQAQDARKIAGKYGYQLPGGSSPFDELIDAMAKLLGIIDSRIAILRSELTALNNCKKNKTSPRTTLARSFGYVGGQTAYDSIYFYGLYLIPTFVKDDAVTLCMRQFVGPFAGKFVPQVFRKDPCGFGGNSCKSKVPSGYRGYAAVAWVTTNIPLENVLDEGEVRVNSYTPGGLEVAAFPASGQCSDFD